MTKELRPTEALVNLLKLIERAHRIAKNDEQFSKSLIADARQIVHTAKSQTQRIAYKIAYLSDEEAARVKHFMEYAKDIAADKIISQAEMWRDTKLMDLAAELEQIRAIIPQLAAKAAVDLGQIARIIRFEVENEIHDTAE